MAFDVERIDYYTMTVAEQVGDGSRLLSVFAGVGVDLLAFKAVSLAPGGARFTLFPRDGSKMTEGARKAGVELDGPRPALLVKGGEKPGAWARIYEKLSQAKVPVREASGLAHINGGYGVILYLEPEDCERAAAALKR